MGRPSPDPGAGDHAAVLADEAEMDLLRFIACGRVDDGKSTLIGRLLHDAGLVPEDQLAAAAADSLKFGTRGRDLDLALLLDGLQAEREQRITIDVAYRFFATARRRFIVADAPGHEQYTRNMATGASTSEAAVVLVDARRGIAPQTHRHSFIVSLLGIRHVILAVNKMDLVGWDEGRFAAITGDYLDFARKIGIDDVRCVPVSALVGANVLSPKRQDAVVPGPGPAGPPGEHGGLDRRRRPRVPNAGPMGEPARSGLPRLLGHHRLGDGASRRPGRRLSLGTRVHGRADRHR